MLTERERSYLRVHQTPSGDCLLWSGQKDRDGYGICYFRRKNRRAHRVAWFSVHGDIPTGMVINHTCRNRACVNPQHLNLLSRSENSMRDSASLGYINSQKTVCKAGHQFDGSYIERATGKRRRTCSVCERAKKARLRARWAAADTLNV